MKKILLLLVALNLVFGLTILKAQDCINYELGQEGIGTLSETFGVSLADFDGDGWLDVVTIDAYDDIEVYFNDGTGQIDTNAYTLGANRWRFGVQVIDIENDGDWDFVTAPFSSNSYGIEVWENNGSGSFSLKSDNTANYSSGHELAIGDLNGDGYDDIFFPNSDKVGVYLNDGTGDFVDNGQELSASSPESAVLFDADNDGDLDAAVSRGFPAKFFLNDGTGHFTEAQDEMADDTEGVDAADINGDGYLDLVFAPWYGYIEIWYNDGLGSFLPGDTLFEAGQIFSIDIELRDVNYDNLPDILTDTYILENDPTNPGTFIVTSNYLTGSTHDFESADINNDGFLDIYKGRFSSNDGDLVYYYQPGTLLYSDTSLCFGDSLFIGGMWQTEPGEYIGSVGCDSNQVVNLSFYEDLNTNVMLVGHTLTSLAIGVSYQWIDCTDSSFVEGATGQSFTPEVSGDYAVILTDGPCSAMTECYTVVITGLDKLNADNIVLYPNPNNGFFVLKTGEYKSKLSFDITDVMGNVVYQSKDVGQNTRIDLNDCPSGVYVLTLRSGNSIVIKRIIKQ
ncbi:MAG: T9SS type A sorting domain-containing protein [Chlorobi bacterium]|nr:T9SS type A sorting domain-containing protein [Chlorobiota bacterium]